MNRRIVIAAIGLILLATSIVFALFGKGTDIKSPTIEPDSREAIVLRVLNSYNEAITQDEDAGYSYLADRVKQDERYDTVDKYRSWLTKVRKKYPQLGTENIRFNYSETGSTIFGFKDGDELDLVISDQGEELNDFKITEILTDNGDCKLLFSERSKQGVKCLL